MILWSFEELLGVPLVWQVVLRRGCPRTWLPTLPSWDSSTSQAPGCRWPWGQGEGQEVVSQKHSQAEALRAMLSSSVAEK